MSLKQCSICDKTFEAVTSAKYCTDCRQEGERKRRQAWRKDNDSWREKKRQWDRDYRSRKTKAKHQATQEEKQKASEQFNRELAETGEQRHRKTITAAASGNLRAQQQLAREANNMREYYRLEREILLTNDREFNITPNTRIHRIGGISVYDPNFVDQILAVLEQSKNRRTSD